MELKTYFAQDAAGNIISSAIVNVFLQGTTTLATGLTRADGTPLENPFAADGAGRIQFRAPDGYYDVQVSAGPGIIQTLTIQCVDYSGAKADADRAESAANRADASAEQASDIVDGIITYSGELVAVPELTPVPKHSKTDISDALDSQAQALLNRQEKLKADLGFLCFDSFPGDNDDQKWSSMIAYINNAVVKSVAVSFPGRTLTFTVSPDVITKPFDFVGNGRRSTILKFINCNGITADLSAYGSRYIQSRIANMSIVTTSEKTHTGIYFKGVQSYAPHDPALLLEHVSLFGARDIDNTAPANTEWLKALHLDDADEITLSDVYICGSAANASYATRTLSWGIFANQVTSLIIDTADILLVGIGLEVNGQSEGFIGDGVTIVAVDYGVLFRNMVPPCNNHVLTNSHIAAYTMGIEFREDKTTPGNHSSSVYLSNIFLLEREGNASKPYYTAIQANVIRSCLDNITIQSNSTTSPNRSGIIISNQDNMLSNIFGLNAGTLLNIEGVADGYVYYNNVRCRGDLQALLTGDVQYAVGAGLGAYASPTNYDVRCDTFKTTDVQGRSQYESYGGRHMFGGGRHNTNVYLDFRTTSGVNTTYDGRLLFTGGTSGVDGQSDAYLYAKTTRFSGNITPTATNERTVGTAGFTWAGGFTQTAFTVTSDENEKTTPLEITDAMLDAASEVDWVQYKYLDRVEVKGPDGARWHFGAIAQRYIEAFARHGLDAHDYGFLCHDEWEYQPEETLVHPAVYSNDGVLLSDEYVEVIRPEVQAGSRYGIRYEEALALEAALQRRNYQRLLARIEALEKESVKE